ncbi:MAG TPA: hypothetical protein VMZ22_12570 [Acidimicrobiales bacterium]|nr:hypothetical protein [Acidimicrobiales bacterium]
MTRTRWTQILLGLNLVTLLPLAIWPLVSPRSFYGDFPGGPYHWIDINGPYNEHFLRDFGALNAAIVVVIVFALWKPSVALLQATGVAIAVYALPHMVYHLAHLDVYEPDEKLIAVAPLALQFFMGLAVVWLATSRNPVSRHDVAADSVI